MSITASQFVAEAQKYLGYKIDGEPHLPFQVPYSCSRFPSYLFDYFEIRGFSEDSPGVQMGDFERAGRLDNGPEIGGLAFFDLSGGLSHGTADHVGIIVDINGADITTIENNALDSIGINEVAYHKRSGVVNDYTLGFGYPPFEAGRSTVVNVPPPSQIITPGTSIERIIVDLGILQGGVTGNGVGNMQALLFRHGYQANQDFATFCDADFGPNTDRMVRNFQADRGLEVDGIVGPVTWRSLLDI